METKQCRICHKIKPLSEFGKHSTTKDGLKLYCKECVNLSERNNRSINYYPKESFVEHFEPKPVKTSDPLYQKLILEGMKRVQIHEKMKSGDLKANSGVER